VRGVHVHPVAPAEQVAAFDELHAHQPGEQGVLATPTSLKRSCSTSISARDGRVPDYFTVCPALVAARIRGVN
jgi:hypothetical protein